MLFTDSQQHWHFLRNTLMIRKPTNLVMQSVYMLAARVRYGIFWLPTSLRHCDKVTLLWLKLRGVINSDLKHSKCYSYEYCLCRLGWLSGRAGWRSMWTLALPCQLTCLCPFAILKSPCAASTPWLLISVSHNSTIVSSVVAVICLLFCNKCVNCPSLATAAPPNAVCTPAAALCLSLSSHTGPPLSSH